MRQVGVSLYGFGEFSGIVAFLFLFHIHSFLFQENMKVLLRLVCLIAVLIPSLEAGKLSISSCSCLLRNLLLRTHEVPSLTELFLFLTCFCWIPEQPASLSQNCTVHSLIYGLGNWGTVRLRAQARLASVRAGAKIQASNVKARPPPTLLLIEECDRRSWLSFRRGVKCSHYEPTAESHQEIVLCFFVFVFFSLASFRQHNYFEVHSYCINR